MSALSIKDELLALEARKAELQSRLDAPEMPELLHPRMADVYREKVGSLCLALESEESRTGAVEAIRALIEAILLEPDGERLKITLKGDLAGMLSAARDSKRSPDTGDLLVQIKPVAGAGFEPPTFGFEQVPSPQPLASNQKGIRPPLLPDGRRRTVARIHLRIVAERKENPADRIDQRLVVAARQVGPADRSGKERVADEERLAGRSPLSHLQADAARTVAGRVVGPHVVGDRTRSPLQANRRRRPAAAAPRAIRTSPPGSPPLRRETDRRDGDRSARQAPASHAATPVM